MFTDLETQRLILKSIGREDASFFYRQFSTDEVNEFLYDVEPCAPEEEALQWIEFHLEREPRNQHRWIIILRESGERIGICGFHCRDRERGYVEVGYDLQPQYRRCGIMTEALTEILRFASDTMKVKRVAAHIFVGNTVSIRTALKVGFKKTQEQYFDVFRGIKYMNDVYIK